MLHRPYIRNDVRAEVEARAQKNSKGQFLDANTGKPIEGKYDLGHKTGHEFRTEQAKAEQEGLTQEEFNEKMNNPDLYQIEDPSSNRSHQFEAKEENLENEEQTELTIEQNTSNEQTIDSETVEESEANGPSESESISEGEGEGQSM